MPISHIRYSHRVSVINLCDRHSTLLSDTDISFSLFNLFTLYVIQLSDRVYSGTCAIRQLSFPTSCDIRQKFLVPKIFFNILCQKTLCIPEPVTFNITQDISKSPR